MSLERGMCYSEVLKALSDSRIKIINKGDLKLLAETALTQIFLPTYMQVILVKVIAEFLERFCSFLRIPTNTIMPSLTLYIEKC